MSFLSSTLKRFFYNVERSKYILPSPAFATRRRCRPIRDQPADILLLGWDKGTDVSARPISIAIRSTPRHHRDTRIMHFRIITYFRIFLYISAFPYIFHRFFLELNFDRILFRDIPEHDHRNYPSSHFRNISEYPDCLECFVASRDPDYFVMLENN